MNRPFPRVLPVAALLVLSSCASSQAQPPQAPGAFPTSLFNRVLIVSGGPNARYTQYAIESNARYVASLTRNAPWRRILFADGKPQSRTVSTLVDTPRTHARAVATWVWRLSSPADQIALRAPTLAPISGSSTPNGITQGLRAFTTSSNDGERQLLYFTGHGAPGSDLLGHEDFNNTVYAAWGDDFSTRQLARELQRSKSRAPLVLVMVQCHSGGFANAMFRGGDPAAPVWNRDFCGFFASTADRQASGCTEQVNERDYQDFTTHFFAALSGMSRDGRAITGADYDGDGRVSLDEAYAYAQINDNSIDVPLCTSDAFLRHVFLLDDKAWQKTSFSRLVKGASPWQVAVLNGLSAELGLSGESRVRSAQTRLAAIGQKSQSKAQSDDWQTPEGVDEVAFNAAYARLKEGLNALFPHFQTLRGEAKTRSLDAAVTFLVAQTSDLNTVYRAYELSEADSDGRDVEEARLLRFLRCARSITLEERLKREGTAEQKAVFARLRTSEGRSAF